MRKLFVNEPNFSMASEPSIKQSLGVFYVVATPIGNLADVSERMRHILAKVSYIAAEDTRRTRLLLSHIDINTPCFSVHDHNERQKIDYIVSLLEEGHSVALVSDAGTPLISDPGYPIVNHLRAKNMRVVPIPGPCAFVTALSVAGLPSDRFIFEGFLPAKSSQRSIYLTSQVKQTATLIFYESSHRIKACLQDIAEVFEPDRQVVITRELTKTFETFLSGTAAELVQLLNTDPNQCKGEFVVLIKGAEKKLENLSDDSKILALKLVEYLPGKQAAKIAAEIYGEKKNKIYQFLLETKG
jgi:16S rRNA (cytidine1402-2'-O)-methyltransferase